MATVAHEFNYRDTFLWGNYTLFEGKLSKNKKMDNEISESYAFAFIVECHEWALGGSRVIS